MGIRLVPPEYGQKIRPAAAAVGYIKYGTLMAEIFLAATRNTIFGVMVVF
jgi:hypothetical protein